MFILPLQNYAQELNCVVQVATEKIQTSDRRIFETLQTSIREFMNDRKWTNYSLTFDEKIETPPWVAPIRPPM